MDSSTNQESTDLSQTELDWLIDIELKRHGVVELSSMADNKLHSGDIIESDRLRYATLELA